jgi:hypothetical protein
MEIAAAPPGVELVPPHAASRRRDARMPRGIRRLTDAGR